MDFADRIKLLATRVNELRGLTKTEEATKTSLILPFLQTLGYDAFDPRIVVPEFTADVGTKKGEKVDYAIKRNGEVIMLIEAKCAGDPLDAGRATQLHRYFHSILSAKIAILTDGVVYKFFTDLEQQNVMDEKPFMEFDFRNIEDALIGELKKLCNDCFSVEVALCAAQDLKYLRQFKRLVAEEMKDPSDEMVKYFARQVYSKSIYANMLEGFKDRLRLAFEHHINDVINARLQGAMQSNAYQSKQVDGTPCEEAIEKNDENQIVTTEEEIEGFHIVKSILREVVNPARIGIRDAMSYCNVLLDDNNRKSICRMHFNAASAKYLEIYDAQKKGTRHKIESLDDIYQFAEQLKQTAKMYE